MKHRTEEQERILNLAKWGECREILEELSERQLRSFPPAFTSRLLFEVVPLNTRPARELAMFVLNMEDGTGENRTTKGCFCIKY